MMTQIAMPIPRQRRNRSGTVLVLFVVLLPALVAVLALVIDGSLLLGESRQLQHIADAAAMAGARELQLGETESVEATALEYIEQHNGAAGAAVTVNVPPTDGPYTGNVHFVEVVVTRNVTTYLMQFMGENAATVMSRSVAGFKPSTAGVVVAVLDPDPPEFSLAPLPVSLPSLTPLLGGMEVLGLGALRVEGAVAVNTTWGGVDENGNPAGSGPGPPYGITCMPLLPTTRLRAEDIRVVGGVDAPQNYDAVDPGDPSPLRANRLPIPDPYAQMPVPTIAASPLQVSDDYHGGIRIVGLPLIGPTTTLNPGVYDWIEIVSGKVVFNPGVYVIRNVNPATGIALSILAGQVTAEGVMFYVTNSPGYSVDSGSPDASDATDDSDPPPPMALSAVVPSVVINALLGNRFSPLADPGGPFDGVLIFQRRNDRRPIVLVKQELIGGAQISGTIYAKWSELILAGNGAFQTRLAVGSLRVAVGLNITIAPDVLMPPAEDVYLVE